ncbi:MAG: Mur ligase family protein [bacterium]|nr:Mur ligase family protein [bacterium]
MNKIFNKIKFFLRKPKVVIVIGESEENKSSSSPFAVARERQKMVKEAIFQVLKQYFKLDKDVLIFETEEKEINKFAFYLKNSKLPILVITGINDIYLVKNLPVNTHFVLNYDDEKAKEINNLDNFKTMKFGFKEENDIFVSDIKENGGTNFKVNYDGKSVPFWLDGLLGQEQIYAILAAISVGTILGLNLVEISQSFKYRAFTQ